MLNGQIVAMSPRPTLNHNIISGNIFRIFSNYLVGKNCSAFGDGVDVFLTEKDRVVPDTMVVCNKNYLKRDGIHGAPDLIVEVLSQSTFKNDKGYKKDLYEHCGVKEYWIVDPRLKTIEVYLLVNGRYAIAGSYFLYEQDEIAEMSEEERSQIEYEFTTSLFEDLKISIAEIFDKTL